MHSSVKMRDRKLFSLLFIPLSPITEDENFSKKDGKPHRNIVWRIWNFDTNEYPNIFVSKKTIRTNIRIYSYQKNNTNEYPNIFVSKKWYERISEYIRIKNDTNMIQTNIPNRKYSNIRIYLYQIIVPTNI